MNEIILEAFDSSGWIKYNKKISVRCGLEAAIMLGYLIDKHIYWSGLVDGKSRFERVTGKKWNGLFFCTREDIEEEIGLTPHLQRKGIVSLTKSGLLHTEEHDLPKKTYYKIDFSEVESVIQDFNTQSLTILTTCDEQFSPLVVNRFDNNKNKQIRTKNKNTITETCCAKALGESVSRSVYADAVEQWNSTNFPRIRNADLENLNRMKPKKVEALMELIPMLSYLGDQRWLQSNKNLSYVIANLESLLRWKADFSSNPATWVPFLRQNPTKLKEEDYESTAAWKKAVMEELHART